MKTMYISCPSCGQKILGGAVRCSRCGKLQKTPDEQADLIKKLQEPKKKQINVVKLIKYVIFLSAAWFIYSYYSAQIHEIINSLFTH